LLNAIFQSRKQECVTVCRGTGTDTQRDILKQELSKVVYAKHTVQVPGKLPLILLRVEFECMFTNLCEVV